MTVPRNRIEEEAEIVLPPMIIGSGSLLRYITGKLDDFSQHLRRLMMMQPRIMIVIKFLLPAAANKDDY